MNKLESRYFNTAVRMDEALIALLDQKSFEYITVREICDRAGVHRSTFYLHYENTADLLDETVRYMVDRFLSYFPSDDAPIGQGFQNCELAELVFINEKYLEPYLSYIRNNGKVFATALKHAGSFGFERIYHAMFTHIFDPVLERFGFPEARRQYVMMFYLNGINAVVSTWLRNGYKEPIEEIGSIITQCVMGSAKADWP